MGRQAAIRNAPMPRSGSGGGGGGAKWQVASGGRDVPSEDERSASTRLPDSNGASPSASSTELGRQAPCATAENSASQFAKSDAELQKEKEDRARWADVESDGEEVEAFDGQYRNAARAEVDGWGTAGGGKKSKNGKPRPAKAEPLPPAPRPPPAPRQAPAKQPQETKGGYGGKGGGKQEARQAKVREEHWEASWESSAWGRDDSWSSSKKGGSSWATDKRGGSSWDEGGWSAAAPAPEPARTIKATADFKGRGGGKNESFKRGPSVAVNMNSSRLDW